MMSCESNEKENNGRSRILDGVPVEVWKMLGEVSIGWLNDFF